MEWRKAGNTAELRRRNPYRSRAAGRQGGVARSTGRGGEGMSGGRWSGGAKGEEGRRDGGSWQNNGPLVNP